LKSYISPYLVESVLVAGEPPTTRHVSISSGRFILDDDYASVHQ